MAAHEPYATAAPSRAEVDALAEPLVLEFGTDWCGFCQVAQPLIAHALAAQPGARHLKIEDGKGRPLGRSFGVRLWPTLVFLHRGREVARLVRPNSAPAIEQALQQLLAVA